MCSNERLLRIRKTSLQELSTIHQACESCGFNDLYLNLHKSPFALALLTHLVNRQYDPHRKMVVSQVASVAVSDLWFSGPDRSPLPELRRDCLELATDYAELQRTLEEYREHQVVPFQRELQIHANDHLRRSELMAKNLDLHLRELLRRLSDSAKTLPTEDMDDVDCLRNAVASHRFALRLFRQLVGVAVTASRFQAHTTPRVRTTFDNFAGLDQVDERSDFTFNYSRWHSSLIKNYEKKFTHEFMPQLRQYGMLTNSGMAAISLALDIIHISESREAQNNQKLLGLFYFKGVFYGEAQRAIARFADREHCLKVDCSASMGDFHETLKSTLDNHPNLVPVIYFDVISPMATVDSNVDFRLLRDTVLQLGVRKCYVVADVTRIGPSDRISSYFEPGTCDFLVFEAESLAKYHLYGQDYTDGGMLRFPQRVVSAFRLPDGSQYSKDNGLKALRANNGYSFPDYVVQSLPSPNRARFFERHSTLSRNAEILWRFLCNVESQRDGLTVSFPGDTRHPFFEWSRYLGTCSSLLHFRLSSCTKPESHSAFLDSLHLHFHAHGLVVPIRGSYGFDNTSLDRFSDGWTRISSGTEDIELVHRIGAELVQFLTNPEW